MKALAKYSLGNRAEAVKEAEKLAQTQQENATVQLLVGTVLQAEGRTEEALELLSKHQGSLEAYVVLLHHPHASEVLDADRPNRPQHSINNANSSPTEP